MRRFDMDPEARMDLYATVEALLDYVKSLHVTLGDVMTDVAAIRDTVFDPVEIAAYRASMRVAPDNAKPLMDEAMRSCDDIIEEVFTSQRWEN